MNKKGTSLVEVIGVIVILSIMISMVALILNFFIQANKRISINSQANYEGNLVIRNIEEDLRDLGPTTFSTCPGVCYEFNQEFSYELNPVTQQVELVVYNAPISYNLEINKQVLYIDSIAYTFDNFILSGDSTMIVEQVGGYNYLEIKIILESTEGYIYEFLLNYTFEEQVIPNA